MKVRYQQKCLKNLPSTQEKERDKTDKETLKEYLKKLIPESQKFANCKNSVKA